VIGFGAGWDPDKEAQCVAAGVTELLVSPVTVKKFRDSIDRAIHKKRDSVQENLFAFLPAKAGSGCSTIVLNVAGYLAGPSGKDLRRKRVLLIETDLNSGVISILLGLKHPYSVLDALENSAQLDYSLWSKYAVQAQGIDVLLSSQSRKASLPSWTDYLHLLDFASSRYDYILVDLPEVVNEATVEIVRRAQQVFVVCTPETPSLALAPQRFKELRRKGIAAEKIGVLLNRWLKGGLGPEDVETLLDYQVCGVFGNDYVKVCEAARRQALVDPGTKLGKSFTAFVGKLTGMPEVAGDPKPWSMRAFGSRLAPQSHI
jgi:pilus assembly protein CpaE